MAKDKAPPADGEAPKKKKSKLVLLLLLVVLLGGLGAGGWFAYQKFFVAPKAEQAEGAEGGAGENKGDHKAEAKGGEKGAEKGKDGKAAKEEAGKELMSLPPFLVNLNDPLGRRYLKLSLDVELVNKEAVAQLTKDMPKAKDAIILLLSSKTFQEIGALENKILLRNEIADRLNQILGGPKVTRVYFTDFIVQ